MSLKEEQHMRFKKHTHEVQNHVYKALEKTTQLRRAAYEYTNKARVFTLIATSEL